MIKIKDNLYRVYSRELKNHNASDFKEDSTIYVLNKKTDEAIYIINLVKTFSLRSYLEDARTFKKIDCTAGSSKGFTPYYIKDFICR